MRELTGGVKGVEADLWEEVCLVRGKRRRSALSRLYVLAEVEDDWHWANIVLGRPGGLR